MKIEDDKKEKIIQSATQKFKIDETPCRLITSIDRKKERIEKNIGTDKSSANQRFCQIKYKSFN